MNTLLKALALSMCLSTTCHATDMGCTTDSIPLGTSINSILAVCGVPAAYQHMNNGMIVLTYAHVRIIIEHAAAIHLY